MATFLHSSTPITKKQSLKRARVSSNLCPKCDKQINTGTDSMTCSICELDFCLDCSSISPTLLMALKEDKTENFKWTCNTCKQNFPSMTSLKTQLRSIEENTQTRLAKVEEKITTLDSGIDDKISNKITYLKSDVVKEIKDEIKGNLQSEVRTELREIEDQRQRTLNLICFNLEESTSKTSEVRKDHDLKKFKELCEAIGVKDVDIKLSFRLGNFHSGSTKPRPLKVIFNNKRQRKEIVDNTMKIRRLPTTSGLNKCIIVKDLTVRQRNERKQKREEKLKTVKDNKNAKEETEPKQLDVFEEDTIADSTIIEATLKNINTPEEMEETPSQHILQGIRCEPLHPQNKQLTVDIQVHHSKNSQVSPFSELGDETIMGGFDTHQNILEFSGIGNDTD